VVDPIEAVNQFPVEQSARLRAATARVTPATSSTSRSSTTTKTPQQARAQDEQYGDVLGLKTFRRGFGRIAAQTAKQVLLQRTRDVERENVFNEYKDRKGEIVTGIARRLERGNLIVDLGRAEAVLPVREQVPREVYRPGDRVQAFVLDVLREAKGPQIILSRASVNLLTKLFEMEVPEIAEGIVVIEAAAREPGRRSKIAVSSRDGDVDPVGACVGIKGSRVQAVVQELRGEKIDIVEFDEDPARFVCAALAPAEVSRVIIDEANHAMEIIVPDDQLSLAIGRSGQNVRLAWQLTGWKLDINSESRVKEMREFASRSLGSLPGVNEMLVETLYAHGFRMAKDVADANPDMLSQIPGIDAGRIPAMQEPQVAHGERRRRARAPREARARGPPPRRAAQAPGRTDPGRAPHSRHRHRQLEPGAFKLSGYGMVEDVVKEPTSPAWATSPASASRRPVRSRAPPSATCRKRRRSAPSSTRSRASRPKPAFWPERPHSAGSRRLPVEACAEKLQFERVTTE
jgi:N utilization substance protein A